MKARLTIKNEESTSTIIFNDIKSKDYFTCVSDEEEYTVDLKDDFLFTMNSKSHKTIVKIMRKGDSNIEVIDDNGSILLDIDVLAINENNDMISLVYIIDEKKNSITIEYM